MADPASSSENIPATSFAVRSGPMHWSNVGRGPIGGVVVPESAIQETSLLESERAAAFRALAERAERARAQAQAHCQTMERALFRTRALGTKVDGHPRRAPRAAGDGAARVRIAELEETVDGLRRGWSRRAPSSRPRASSWPRPDATLIRPSRSFGGRRSDPTPSCASWPSTWSPGPARPRPRTERSPFGALLGDLVGRGVAACGR